MKRYNTFKIGDNVALDNAVNKFNTTINMMCRPSETNRRWMNDLRKAEGKVGTIVRVYEFIDRVDIDFRGDLGIYHIDASYVKKVFNSIKFVLE